MIFNSLSNEFDLKWTLRMKDIIYDDLKPSQIVNHFKNNIQLTKKSGLTKNLRNLIFKNVDIDNFYPRCYDITERNDFEDFMEDFKVTKVISLIRDYTDESRTENLINIEKIIICLGIIDRKIIEWNSPTSHRKLITDKEWSIISEEDVQIYRKELERLERMNKIGFANNSKKNKGIQTNDTSNNQILIEQFIYINYEKNEYNNSENKFLNKTESELKNISLDYLSKIQKIHPQYFMDGKKNIWIMKPSGLSRGRGIKCVSQLNEILLFIKKNSNQYMVQKYIENPLLILGRKVKIFTLFFS